MYAYFKTLSDKMYALHQNLHGLPWRVVSNVRQNDKIISNLIIKDKKFNFVNAFNFTRHIFVHYNEGLSKETKEEIMAVRMFVRAIQMYFGYEKLINFFI